MCIYIIFRHIYKYYSNTYVSFNRVFFYFNYSFPLSSPLTYTGRVSYSPLFPSSLYIPNLTHSFFYTCSHHLPKHHHPLYLLSTLSVTHLTPIFLILWSLFIFSQHASKRFAIIFPGYVHYSQTSYYVNSFGPSHATNSR